ncbi:MAG: DUF1343 domain-containing protein [Dermatophilaceae bacterium]|nr:DUF1343 domain-containing protein [Dermatophilaceae bacterium]
MSALNRRQLLGAAGLSLAALPLVAGPAAAASIATPPMPPRKGRAVITGAESLRRSGWAALSGQRVGVVTNPTGILDDLTHVVDRMVGSGAVNVVAVFGPEHGFRGTAQAGDSEGNHVDPRTGVMVYDAYGATADKLAGFYRAAKVETVVFDIQDVGARFYTYIWTMYEAMKAAVATGVRFVVLDRPNPVGGSARGPMLLTPYISGVGKKEIVQQHGMTVGELARFFDGEFLQAEVGARLTELTVQKMTGWRREQRFVDTGQTWVMPSPNMPTPDTALLYPGTGLFEATNMSEGRGTTRPFELIGAPYVDYQWAAALTDRKLPGVEFREAYFTPTFSKNAGKVCGGVQIHVTDPAKVEAITVATHMMVEARRLYAGFDWRTGDTYAGRWSDLLTGSPRFREMLTTGAPAAEIVGAWRGELSEWNRRRDEYLLYTSDQR